MQSRLISGLLLIIVFLLPSESILAQGLGITTGTLSCEVKDESGASIPGVFIRLNSNNGTKTANTDSQGKFIFPYLTPGNFDVRAELDGFTTVEQNNIRIGLGQRIEISFRLRPAVHETVTVVDESPLVDPTNTTIGANIPDHFIQRIPIGRSLADIIYLAPGVVKSGLAGSNFSISGGSGWENAYIIDGAVVTNPGFGTMGVVTNNQNYGTITVQGDSGLPLEMIQEVQVITGGFEPEYGEAQGGIVNIVTKSGTNDFHGQGYFYTTPESAGDKLIDHENGLDMGTSMGGPILKNKLFFFGAYNLSTFKNTLFVQPEWPGYAVVKEVTEKGRTDSYSMKITSNITSHHTLEFSVFGDPSYRPSSNHDGYQLDVSTDPRRAQSIWNLGTSTQTLRWTATIRPSMFLEAQFARAHNRYVNTPDPKYKDLPRIIDQTADYPVDRGGFGGNPDFFGNNLQYNVKGTNLWKSHQFRYGAQFEDISFWSDHERPGGPFTLSDGQTARGYVIEILPGESYGLDQVYMVRAILPKSSIIQTSTKYLNWFVQDSWNLSSVLNIDFGIRWEQQHITGEGEGSIGATFGNNWAPRIGVTYDYLNNEKSKLFFHYGRFFEKLPNSLASQFTIQSAERSFYSDSNLTQRIDTTRPPFQRGIEEVEGHGDSRSSFRTGAQFTNEWIAGIEQEVKANFSLSSRFIYRNLGRVVENIFIDQNAPCIALSGGGCINPPATLEELSAGGPQLIGILTNVDGHITGLPALKREYKAFEITAEKRFSTQWQLMGSYTYARLIGNYEGGALNASQDGNYAISPFTRYSWSEGPLPNDIRHMVKLFGSYQLRSNFNAGAAFYFQTGSPITPIIHNDDFGDFPIAPRGALGRTDSATSVDIHIDYTIGLFRNRMTIGLDIFNLFNSHAMTGIDSLAGWFYPEDLTYIDPNPYFLGTTEFQQSRTIRGLVRYSF
jgi:hypothetical protein